MLELNQPVKRIASGPLGLSLIWLLLAISSIVQIQPAPYDGLVVVLGLGFLAMGMRVPSGIRAPALLLGLFLLAYFISALCIPDPSFNFATPGHSILALPTTALMIYTWLFFVSIVYEDPERVLKTIWKGYLVAAIIATAFGVLVHYNLIHVSGMWTESAYAVGRVRGTFKDPNVYGPFVVVAIVYLVSTLETATRIGVLLRSALLGFLAWGILLSYSRGAWANLVVTLGIFLSLRIATARTKTHQLKVMLLTVTLILGATGGMASLILGGDMNSLFYERLGVQSYDVDKGGRFDSQRKAFDHILRDPIGVGPGRAEHAIGRVPHNLYLYVPLEAGWLGAIGLYGFILLTIVRSFSFCLQPTPLQRTYAVIFASTIGTALESFIIDTTHWRHMFLLWGMLWGPMLAWKSTHDRLAVSTATSRPLEPSV